MLRIILGFLLGLLARTLFASHSATLELGERIVVGVRPAGGAVASFCEGTYTCATSGSVFTSGARSKIGFWGVSTCPGTTTLSDGSVWNLVPLTCDCP